MKTSIKWLALLLSVIMSTGVFAACDGGSSESDTIDKVTNENVEQTTAVEEVSVGESASQSGEITVVETEELFVPDISKKNYNEELYMLVYGGDTYMKFVWTEESDGSLLNEAVFTRQTKLMEHIGVELVGIPAEGFHGYNEPFMASVKNKDGAIDLFLPNYYLGIAGMISNGYMYNLSQITEFNFDADYWNIGFMDSLSLHGNYYLGYSDYNVMKAYVLTYNKDMFEKYSSAFDETLYESVYNYRWTLDKMLSVMQLVYVDATGDGKTDDDTFGFSAHQWDGFVPFLQSSGIKLVDLNDAGEYVVSVLNDINAYKTTEIVSKLKKLAESQYSWFRYKDNLEPKTISLETGRVLMNIDNTATLDKYLNYDLRFGVLPYPMYDENQKDSGYISLNYDTYITLPSYMRNYDMVVESVELLSYYSSDVRSAVFDKWLGKQASDEPDDAKMLDIVWDGICSDFGLTYSTITMALDNNLYMLPTLTEAGTDKNVASYVASYTKSANSSINKYMKKLGMGN